MKKCPFCAEEIQDDAMKCRYCGEFLEKSQTTQQLEKASEVKKEESSSNWSRYFIFILFVGFVFIYVGIRNDSISFNKIKTVFKSNTLIMEQNASKTIGFLNRIELFL